MYGFILTPPIIIIIINYLIPIKWRDEFLTAIFIFFSTWFLIIIIIINGYTTIH